MGNTTIVEGEIVHVDEARDNEPVGTSLAQPLAEIQPLTVAELVERTLLAVENKHSGSPHTRRAYETAIGYFLYFYGLHKKDMLQAELAKRGFEAGTLLPLASRQRGVSANGKPLGPAWWEFSSAPAGVLNFITPALLDWFMAWQVNDRPEGFEQGECNPVGMGNSKSTISKRVPIINTFLKVAFREGVIQFETIGRFTLGYNSSPVSRKGGISGRRLTVHEVRNLRATVIGVHAAKDEGEAISLDEDGRPSLSNKGCRDRAILDTMLYAGLRRAEVASLTTGDVTQKDGRWILVVTGKGSKIREVPILDELKASLDEWLDAAGLAWHTPDQPLFVSINKGDRVLIGRPITGTAIGRLVAEYGAAARLAPRHGDNRLSAHDLRRTFARRLYDRKAQLPYIQALLGHASVETTMAYIGVGKEDHFDAILKLEY